MSNTLSEEEELKLLWEKPERFGDSNQIYLRQYKVNVTTDLKTVSDHVILTESDVFIPGMGVMRWIVLSPGAPEGLEQIDQTTPIGSPWESKQPDSLGGQ